MKQMDFCSSLRVCSTALCCIRITTGALLDVVCRNLPETTFPHDVGPTCVHLLRTIIAARIVDPLLLTRQLFALATFPVAHWQAPDVLLPLLNKVGIESSLRVL